MRRLAQLSLLLILVGAPSAPAYAQRGARAPFAALDAQVKKQPGGWSGWKQPLATLFNAERRRLRGRFERELLRYIEGDVEKHYWASLFLVEPAYLQGNRPLPELSLFIKHQALALLRDREGEVEQGYVVMLSVTAAVVSETVGLGALARAYKNEAERLLAEKPALAASFPALGERERRIYDSINSDAAAQRKPSVFISEAEDEPRARVSAGILNGRALNRLTPAYPPEARTAGASGEVRVRIVFDETGRVIWAKAISGHQLLHAAAVEAARQTRFKPVTIGGKPEKVMGILVYTFVP
jgi:TonB family protein